MTAEQRAALKDHIGNKISLSEAAGLGGVRIEGCDNTFRLTDEWAQANGLSDDAEIAALKARACCDCELVLNNML